MASEVTTRKPRFRRRKVKPRLVVIHGGRELGEEEGQAVLAASSERLRIRQENHEFSRASRRLERTDRLPPDRRSVARAMILVEIKFVKALWVLERAVSSDGARGHASRNGVDYLHDRLDHYANALANGGWKSPAPRPALPSSKEIDEAVRVQRWLEYLDPQDARLLTIGAMSKRGDAGRRINWMRVRDGLPEIKYEPIRTLQAAYQRALRHMVAELAMRGIN